MTFRRLAVPTYFGGLPAAGYAYINNAVAGTPSVFDTGKIGGVNAGTFFIAFGEDATTLNTNRANKALAENCDWLDDLLNTSQVVMRSVSGTTVGATTSIVVTGDIYVGGSAETPAVVDNQDTRNTMIRMINANGNDIVVGGVTAEVLKIHDGAAVSQVGVPAGGFYTNPTIDLTVSVPNGTSYTIYYLTRRSLSDIIQNKPSEFFASQVRSLGKTPGYSLIRFDDLYLHGMDERYRRASAYDATPPAQWPGVAPVADTPGNGAWFVKDGYPVAGYVTAATRAAYSGSVGIEEAYCGATFYAELDLSFIPSTSAHRGSAGSGFVVAGRARTDSASDPMSSDPGLFGFAHFTRRVASSGSGGTTTHFLVGDPVTMAVDQATLGGGGAWYRNLAGADRSGVVKDYDIFVMTEDATGDLFYFTVGDITNATVATLRYLDGSHPNLVGAFTIVEWLSPLFYSAEGAAGYYTSQGFGNTLEPAHAGVTIAETPGVRNPVSLIAQRKYLRLFAADQLGTSRTMGWGGFNELDPTGVGAVYDEFSFLNADGGAEFNGTVEANATPTASAANDTVPVLQTTVAATNNKLLWETAGSAAGKVRMYCDTTGFIFTQNAEWTGAQWERDNVAAASAHYAIKANGNMSIKEASAAANPITWSTSVRDVGKYVTQELKKVTSTTAFATSSTTPATITGMTTTVAVKIGDIVKIRASGSVEKTGTTNGGRIQLSIDAVAIADSVRFFDTSANNGITPWAVSTLYTAVADATITVAAEANTTVGVADAMDFTTMPRCLEVEVVRPG